MNLHRNGPFSARSNVASNRGEISGYVVSSSQSRFVSGFGRSVLLYSAHVLIEMSAIPHIPTLRRGRAYESLDKIDLVSHRTNAPLAQISTVNAGIIRKDLQRIGESRAALKKFTVAQ